MLDGGFAIVVPEPHCLHRCVGSIVAAAVAVVCSAPPLGSRGRASTRHARAHLWGEAVQELKNAKSLAPSAPDPERDFSKRRTSDTKVNRILEEHFADFPGHARERPGKSGYNLRQTSILSPTADGKTRHLSPVVVSKLRLARRRGPLMMLLPTLKSMNKRSAKCMLTSVMTVRPAAHAEIALHVVVVMQTTCRLAIHTRFPELLVPLKKVAIDALVFQVNRMCTGADRSLHEFWERYREVVEVVGPEMVAPADRLLSSTGADEGGLQQPLGPSHDRALDASRHEATHRADDHRAVRGDDFRPGVVDRGCPEFDQRLPGTEEMGASEVHDGPSDPTRPKKGEHMIPWPHFGGTMAVAPTQPSRAQGGGASCYLIVRFRVSRG